MYGNMRRAKTIKRVVARDLCYEYLRERARVTGRLHKGPLCDCDVARLILLAVHEEQRLNGRCFLPSPSPEDSITGQSSRRLPPLPRSPRTIVAGHERHYVPPSAPNGAQSGASRSRG